MSKSPVSPSVLPPAEGPFATAQRRSITPPPSSRISVIPGDATRASVRPPPSIHIDGPPSSPPSSLTYGPILPPPSSRPERRTIEISTPRGELSMSAPALRVVAYRVIGHLDLALADRMLEHVDARLAMTLGRFVAFHDWVDMTGYDTAARLRLTSWVLEHRSRFESIHILSQSKLVAMGIAVANLALDRFLIAYDACQRARYEAALGDIVTERAYEALTRVG